LSEAFGRWHARCNITVSAPKSARLLDVRTHYFEAAIDDGRELIEVIAGYLKAKLSEFLF
jgi:hypothetical protein